MSQEKVDRYKEEKKNREKNKKKAKIKKILIIFLVALIIGGGIGFPLGRWFYNYKKTHVNEEEVFVAYHDYETWFNNYWVEKYSDFYTGAELATEGNTEGTGTEPPASEAGKNTEAASTEAASTEGTEAQSTEGTETVPSQELTPDNK